MDTAHALITQYPGREVNLVAGSGTFFSDRDRLFPTGGRRWWGGTLATRIFTELGRRFDGTNETDVATWLRTTYGTWLAVHNLSLVLDSIPNKVFLDCGIDLDRWYPLPRRMIETTRFMLTHRRGREHLRQTLDTVRTRFDVRCGPLNQASPSRP
ncbi:hypothetical protein [Nocardia sp. NPDC057272]|uniref:hypothetical protein n=1 Tax=Nocardia sp. NPDC057272 TaxID=3346079 RepID=UPI00363099A8